MYSKLFYALSLVALAGAANAATAPQGGKVQYDHCLARVASNPAEALLEAQTWQKAGGGPASIHCTALALVAQHRYVEAGTKLDALARGGFASDPATRMALFDQAGNAWLLAGKADNAIASFSAALAIDPSDADLLADRARANALKRVWPKADADLSAALLVNPRRADLLVLRGSARHAMSHKKEALSDYERALKVQPGYVDALLERGTMKYESGDITGARADWNSVILTSPKSAAANVARQRLTDTTPSLAVPPNAGVSTPRTRPAP